MGKLHKKYNAEENRHRRPLFDRHHFLFPEDEWSTGAFRELRTLQYCVARVPVKTTHRVIHNQIDRIPLPKESSVEKVLSDLGKLQLCGAINKRKRAEDRLCLLADYFDGYGDRSTARALRQQANIIRKVQTKPP